MEFLEVGDRFLGGGEIGFAHDLDQGNPGPVEIERGPLPPLMDRFSRILLEVDPGDPDLLLPPLRLDDEAAARGQGATVLGDLIPLGQVGVEVVLPGKEALSLDPAGERQCGFDRKSHRFLVQHGEGTRHSEADRADVRVGFRAEVGGAAAEDLRRRLELAVDLEADDRLERVILRDDLHRRFPVILCLDHAGDEERSPISCGCAPERRLPVEPPPWPVGTQGGGACKGVCGGREPFRLDAVELFDVVEDLFELRRVARLFFLRQCQMCKLRDISDTGFRDLHR